MTRSAAYCMNLLVTVNVSNILVLSVTYSMTIDDDTVQYSTVDVNYSIYLLLFPRPSKLCISPGPLILVGP